MTKRKGFHWSKMYDVMFELEEENFPVIVTYYDNTGNIFHTQEEFYDWYMNIHKREERTLKSGFVYYDMKFEDVE